MEELRQLKTSLGARSHDINEDFSSLFHRFFGPLQTNDTCYEADLSHLVEMHQDLMEECMEIHHRESNAHLRARLETGHDLAKIAQSSPNGSRAKRIYTLNDAAGRYVYIGDIHSDPESLLRIVDHLNFVHNYMGQRDLYLIFTGDYVDRGHKHLDVISVILLLKYLFADRVFLLRGNHDGGIRQEDGTVKLPYSIPEEDDPMAYFPRYTDALAEKNKTFPTDMTDRYLAFFDSLAYLAITSTEKETLLAVHGGLPRPTLDLGAPVEDLTTVEGGNTDAKDIDHKVSVADSSESVQEADYFAYIPTAGDLTNEDLKDHLGRTILQNIMWSDPDRGDGDLRLHRGRFRFTEEHLNAFMTRFHISLIIRGHEAHE